MSAYGRLDPDRAAIVADSIVVCAADSASLANSILDLDLQVLLRKGENQWYDPGEVGGGGGGAEPPVTDAGEFIAEPRGRGIQLRWDPTETVYGEPVTRYVVFVETENGPGSFYPVGEVFGATRLEVLDIAGERIEPFDANGDPIEYRFAVRACAGGRCALLSELSITNQPNFAQHEGWPKTVPSGLTTAPLTVNLDGREAVFVAGREIYAWWLDDGTSVAEPDSGKPDGFFYDPQLPLEASTMFAEKLVELPLYDDGERTGTAIVGNVIRDAVYAIEAVGPDGNGYYEPDEIWSKQIKGWATAPMVLELNPIDLDSEYQVAIAGRTDTLYVWMDDGEPHLSNYTTNPGAYAYFAAGGPSHRTLAEWYYPWPDASSVLHYIVRNQAKRGGAIYVEGSTVQEFRDCYFYGNEAEEGAAIHMLVPVGGPGFVIENSTFVKNVSKDAAVYLAGDAYINNNIFAFNDCFGYWVDGFGRCGCNLFWRNRSWGLNDQEWGGFCGWPEGTESNEVIDPGFCNRREDDYTLTATSPGLPANFTELFREQGCEGLVGAFEMGCQVSPTREASWGELKRLFGGAEADSAGSPSTPGSGRK